MNNKSSVVHLILAVMPGMTWGNIQQTLLVLLHSNLPMLAVTSPMHRSALVDILAERDVHEVPMSQMTTVGACLGHGVKASPNALGWILLPADQITVDVNAVHAFASSLERHSITHGLIEGRRTYPLAISQELYQESMNVHSEDAFRRLMARYPSHAMPMNFPMSEQFSTAMMTMYG